MTERDGHDLDVLLADAPGGPVVMLSGLRFRPRGGRENCRRYAETIRSSVTAHFGVFVEYLGEGGRELAAEDVAARARVLVRHPNRQAFAHPVRDPGYGTVPHSSGEAPVASVPQPTKPIAV
ncbi:hypothetical protein [Streptomyces sp. NPDC059649]|uniref:hypothetical protein n=1 Tax=Streptomyces sp. NPDC059649 TaxID=3346895 RepID=UPI0036B4627D